MSISDKPIISCLYTITHIYDQLSASHRRIADYIIEHPQRAIHATIDTLAQEIGTSESTLVRFVRKLGYDGYQHFRISLATELISPPKRVYETDIGQEESIIPTVFNSSIETLQATKERLVDGQVLHVAKQMIKANNVALFGLGGSSIVALDGFHKFVRIGLPVKMVQDFHMQLMMASQCTTDDIAILYSHTGINIDAIAIADELRKQGCHTICITSNEHSTLSRHTDENLLVYTKSNGVISEAFSARIAQMAINDALYLYVLKERETVGIGQLEKMQAVISKRRI